MCTLFSPFRSAQGQHLSLILFYERLFLLVFSILSFSAMKYSSRIFSLNFSLFLHLPDFATIFSIFWWWFFPKWLLDVCLSDTRCVCAYAYEEKNLKIDLGVYLSLIQVEWKFQSPILSFGGGDFGIETAKSKLRRKNFWVLRKNYPFTKLFPCCRLLLEKIPSTRTCPHHFLCTAATAQQAKDKIGGNTVTENGKNFLENITNICSYFVDNLENKCYDNNTSIASLEEPGSLFLTFLRTSHFS